MIHNLTKRCVISRIPISARTFLERGRGMIGRRFSGFDAMIFNNCNSIHTMFMSISIDVIFVDCENRICDFRKSLPPWKPFIKFRKAMTVIELPEGVIERTGTEVGDIIDLHAELTEAEKKKLFAEGLISSPKTAITFKEADR